MEFLNTSHGKLLCAATITTAMVGGVHVARMWWQQQTQHRLHRANEWAHAVNTRPLLRSALANPEIRMLEVDICMNEPSGEPVTRHAALSSLPLEEELLLSEWLREVVRHSYWLLNGGGASGGGLDEEEVEDEIEDEDDEEGEGTTTTPQDEGPGPRKRVGGKAVLIEKGGANTNAKIEVIKLDFKNFQCVEMSIRILEEQLSSWRGGVGAIGSGGGGGGGALRGGAAAAHQRPQPPEIWLNADVAKGPGGKPPVQIEDFFSGCTVQIAGQTPTYSLGWTTSSAAVLTGGRYTDVHIKGMMRVCEKHVPRGSKLTFAVRASLVRTSWSSLQLLFDPAWWDPIPSLTLWTANEGVPESDLRWIREMFENAKGVHMPSQIFFDVEKGSKLEWHNPLRWMNRTQSH